MMIGTRYALSLSLSLHPPHVRFLRHFTLYITFCFLLLRRHPLSVSFPVVTLIHSHPICVRPRLSPLLVRRSL